MVYDQKGIKVSEHRPVIVLGVIGNDIHVVANRILEICLNEKNFNVVNIGTNNLPQDFADTALEVCADAVLIGSLNGEVLHWCGTLRELFKVRGIGDALIYIGGNLVTGVQSKTIEKTVTSLGIDRAYHGEICFDTMVNQLRKDIIRGHSIG